MDIGSSPATTFLFQSSGQLQERLAQAVAQMNEVREQVGRKTDQVLQNQLEIQQQKIEAGRIDVYA